MGRRQDPKNLKFLRIIVHVSFIIYLRIRNYFYLGQISFIELFKGLIILLVRLNLKFSLFNYFNLRDLSSDRRKLDWSLSKLYIILFLVRKDQSSLRRSELKSCKLK